MSPGGRAATDANDQTSFFSPLFQDGRPLLTLGTLGLLFSGSFAIFLAATGNFLPQDVQYLGMTPNQLCGLDACRIVHFMIHDRVSFGATLLSLSTLYLWLIHFPLRSRQPWAWWTLLLSNSLGFLSFLTYLGFGYLDTWHALATLLLLPTFATGLALSYPTLPHPRGFSLPRWNAHGKPSAGRLLFLFTCASLVVAGLTITLIGMTTIFVPEDLQYMSTTPAVLNALNPRLIPLIAHDRAGFGGGVLTVGFTALASAWCARPSRHLRQSLTLAGLLGFLPAIAIHPLVGYNNPVHLAPAILGAICYFLGLYLTYHTTPPKPAPIKQPLAT